MNGPNCLSFSIPCSLTRYGPPAITTEVHAWCLCVLVVASFSAGMQFLFPVPYSLTRFFSHQPCHSEPVCCHSDPFAVILIPSAVILIPQSREKNLALPLKVNSAKNLLLPFAFGRSTL